MRSLPPVRPAKPCATRPSARRLEDPDVALMLRVQGDEPGAFAELVQRYWARVFGRFYQRLGDRQEAEDLAQEVFLRVYRHRHRYQPRAKFGTWLFHIIQNLARNALRSRRRRPWTRLGALASPCGEDFLADQVPADRGETPSQPMERAELACAVRTAISHLAGRQRTAMELHQFQDWTHAEIAAEMDMSPKAAKSLLYRARNQLRASLTALMDVDR